MEASPRRELQDLVLVASGAIPGALLRWQLGDVRLANLIGCLVLGLLLASSSRHPRLMLLLGIGFCGSLTTFCSWILDLDRGLAATPWPTLGQLGVDLLTGLAGLAAGVGLARLIRR